MPEYTKDPIVLASQIVLALQTIVSREIHPGDRAVVTVGRIHGGTKNNIIPSEVKLQLTLRSYSADVREHLVASIRRICRGEAIAAGVPDDLMPIVTWLARRRSRLQRSGADKACARRRDGLARGRPC